MVKIPYDRHKRRLWTFCEESEITHGESRNFQTSFLRGTYDTYAVIIGQRFNNNVLLKCESSMI